MPFNAQNCLSIGFLSLLLVVIIHSYRQKPPVIEKNGEEIIDPILNLTEKVGEFTNNTDETEKAWRKSFDIQSERKELYFNTFYREHLFFGLRRKNVLRDYLFSDIR